MPESIETTHKRTAAATYAGSRALRLLRAPDRPDLNDNDVAAVIEELLEALDAALVREAALRQSDNLKAVASITRARDFLADELRASQDREADLRKQLAHSGITP